MRRFLLLLALLAIPSLAHAQATPASKLAWDQANATKAEAEAYTYRHYDDLSTSGVVLTPVTCAGTPILVCQAPFPAFTPGATHTIAVTAANTAGESLKSTPLSFTFVVVPSIPTGLRIVP